MPPPKNWYENPMPYKLNTGDGGGGGIPGRSVPDKPDLTRYRAGEYGDKNWGQLQEQYYSDKAAANPRDLWNWLNWSMNSTGQNLGMFDNEVLSRFMSMPRYNANEERRGIESAINRTTGNMGSVNSTLRGLTSDGGMPTQENKIMAAMSPIAQARMGAESELYTKQLAADQNWLENLNNLLTQRMNVGQTGQGNAMDILRLIMGDQD